jgi:hypothetical protein
MPARHPPRGGRARQRGDPIEAHRGAGTFGACGAQPLAALLLDVEGLGAAGRVAEAATLLPAVAGEVARVREFLEVTLEPAATRDPDATKVEW